LLLKGCGWKRDSQSITFLSGAPTDQLLLGRGEEQRVRASTSSRSRVAVAGNPFSCTSKL